METYYDPDDLPKFPDIGKEAPNLANKFFEYYNAVFEDGELTEREKALIALAVAHAVQCPYCIDAYTQACLEKGSHLGEMTEAIHVATARHFGRPRPSGLPASQQPVVQPGEDRAADQAVDQGVEGADDDRAESARRVSRIQRVHEGQEFRPVPVPLVEQRHQEEDGGPQDPDGEGHRADAKAHRSLPREMRSRRRRGTCTR